MWLFVAELAATRLMLRLIDHILRIRYEREHARATRLIMEVSAKTQTVVRTTSPGRTMVAVTPVGAPQIAHSSAPGDED